MAKYLNSDGLAYFLSKLKPLIDAKADKSHTHSYAGSTSAGGAANSVANSLSIQLNGGTATTFNGSAAKSINVTPSSIGAMSVTANKLRHYLKTVTSGKGKWVCLGIVSIDRYGCTAVIDFYTGDGYNGSAYQNSTVSIFIKRAWQSTNSTTKACSVTVTYLNARGIDVRVVATACDTYKVYMYDPWTEPSGIIEVHGGYKSFTESTEILASAPTTGLQEVKMYDADAAAYVYNALSIQLNGGTATVYNGNAAKSINITPSSIGAAASSHSHNYITLKSSNTTSGASNDIVSTWLNQNMSAHFYNAAGKIVNQPSDYGFLLNLTNGQSDIHQLWMTQPSGNIAHRGGNGTNGWSGTWRTILDSSNYANYVWGSSTNKVKLIQKTIDSGKGKWVCLGIINIDMFGKTAVIDFYTGDGYNGSAYQNSTVNIAIKRAWQSTNSTTKACSAIVKCFNCSAVDVKVVATACDTYKVYMYDPWEYASGNMEVHGEYASFTGSTEILASVPNTGLQDVAVYKYGSAAWKNITYGTSAPSGTASNGDIYIQYS